MEFKQLESLAILKTNIEKLKLELHKSTQKLYQMCIFDICGYNCECSELNLNDLYGDNHTQIINIEISYCEEENDWNISYEHITNRFNSSNYELPNLTNDEMEQNIKELKEKIIINNKPKATSTSTIVNFGSNNDKFYIEGSNFIEFKIYKNSHDELRIINTDYNTFLEIEEQTELMELYSSYFHIPEFLALKIMLHISEHYIGNLDIIKIMKTYI